jgi:hypothetical protein
MAILYKNYFSCRFVKNNFNSNKMSLANYYLDIDSTFRNRESWPNPGNFEAILGSSRATSGNMQDPVSQSEPVNAWTSSLFNVNALGSNNISGQIENINIGNANSLIIIEFKVNAPNLLQQRKNYYRNAVLRNIGHCHSKSSKIDDNNKWGFSDVAKVARISEYIYMGNNRAQVTLYVKDSAFVYNFSDLIEIVDPTDFTDSLNSFLFVPDGSIFDQNYLGKLIYNETLSESRIISNYDNKTNILTISGSSIGSWTTQDNYSIRQDAPTFRFPIDASSTSSQIIITGSAASDVNNTYLAWYIRIPKIIYNTVDNAESRRIVNYDGVTKIATVNPAFSSSPPVGIATELMQYSYDNANPLNWSSSLSQEVPLYSIKLLRLILPNQILAVGTGSKTAYQPYFYVELSSGDPWIPFYNIYSNNPHAVHAIFRASVKDIENLERSQFIALKGDDMKQIMRFKLDSTIRMRILIPSTGQTFKTIMSDTIAPAVPNPAVQINALFEFAPM